MFTESLWGNGQPDKHVNQSEWAELKQERVSAGSPFPLFYVYTDLETNHRSHRFVLRSLYKCFITPKLQRGLLTSDISKWEVLLLLIQGFLPQAKIASFSGIQHQKYVWVGMCTFTFLYPGFTKIFSRKKVKKFPKNVQKCNCIRTSYILYEMSLRLSDYKVILAKALLIKSMKNTSIAIFLHCLQITVHLHLHLCI